MQATAHHEPIPAMVPRPVRPLSTLALLKAASTNSLSVCDEELFDELFVARRYLTQRVCFISDPAGIERVMLHNFENYPRVARIRHIFEEGLGTGLLASEGETWRRHRRLVTPTLDHRAIMPDIQPMIELTERMAEHLEPGPRGVEIDVEEAMTRLLLRAENEVVTGGDPDAEPMIKSMAGFPRKPRFSDFLPMWRWLEPLRPPDKRLAPFEELLYALIDERRSESYSGAHDLIWRLAHANDPKTGVCLSRTETRDEVATLISAGVHASVRALTWIWYLLALDTGVEAKLHAELDSVLAAGALLPDDLRKLVYTRQVLNETMRLYPPVPAILREAAADDVVCGHRVARHSIIAILPWVIHRHRKLWANPDRFDPERFSPENTAARPRLAYIPFAAGPRVCPGAAFSMTQMLLVVAVLARRFQFRLIPEHPVTPMGRITLKPVGGLKMTATRRSAVTSLASGIWT